MPYSPEAAERRRQANAEWWRVNGAVYREANRTRIREISAKHRNAHRDEVRERVKRFQEKYPDRQRASERKYRETHADRRKASCAAYRAKPGISEKERETRRKWVEANKDRLCAKAAERRARKMRATPAWADLSAIGRFYAEARRITRETGIAHHVDHIVPLKSKLVCGLHCEANLQIIVGRDNLSKGNRVWPDMWKVA